MEKTEKILFGAFLLIAFHILFSDGIFCCGRRSKSSSASYAGAQIEVIIAELETESETEMETGRFQPPVTFDYILTDMIRTAPQSFIKTLQEQINSKVASHIQFPYSYGLGAAYHQQMDDFKKIAGLPESDHSLENLKQNYTIPFIEYVFEKLQPRCVTIDKKIVKSAISKFTQLKADEQTLERMKVELLGMIKQLSDASVKRKIELQARSKAKNVRPAATNQQGNSIEMDQIQSDETNSPLPVPERHEEKIKEMINDIGTSRAYLDDFAIDFIMEIAAHQFKDYTVLKMWQTSNTDAFVPEHDLNKNDIQILYKGVESLQQTLGHYVCVRYKESIAGGRNLLVFDSSKVKSLNDSQKKVLAKRYKNIKPIKPKLYTEQSDNTPCGIFALAYATSCFFNQNPMDISYKLNQVFGDEALYMRIHLLQILKSGILSKFMEEY